MKKKTTTKRATKKRSARKKIARKDGITQVSMSLSQSLVDRIDKLAERDNRNRSNFIATCLQEIVDEQE